MPNIMVHHTYGWQLTTFCLSLLPVAALAALVLGGRLEKFVRLLR